MHVYAVILNSRAGVLLPFVKIFRSAKLREEIETDIESWHYDRGFTADDVTVTYLGMEF
jgi:hypothetical protein